MGELLLPTKGCSRDTERSQRDQHAWHGSERPAMDLHTQQGQGLAGAARPPFPLAWAAGLQPAESAQAGEGPWGTDISMAASAWGGPWRWSRASC